MSLTDLEEYKHRMAEKLAPAERQKLEALEAAALTNKRDPRLTVMLRNEKPRSSVNLACASND